MAITLRSSLPRALTITELDGNFTDLDSRVDSAATDITTLEGRVTTNEGDISTLEGRVTTNEGDIGTLQTDIGTLQTDVSGKLDAADGNATGTLSAEIISATDDITTTADLQGANLVDTIIRGKVQALGNITGTNNIDLNSGDTVTCRLTGNTTFTVSGLVSGSVNTVYLVIENSSAGTITFPTTTTFNRGGSIITGTGKTLIILDSVDNGSTWMGVQSWRSYS